jgi:hypothetical protein
MFDPRHELRPDDSSICLQTKLQANRVGLAADETGPGTGKRFHPGNRRGQEETRKEKEPTSNNQAPEKFHILNTKSETGREALSSGK